MSTWASSSGTGSTSGGYFYVSGNTITNTTTTTGVNVGWDTVSEPVAHPLRIAQRKKLSLPRIGPSEVAALEAVGVIEIPSHRVARGLKHFEVEPNTVLELPDGTIIDVEDQYRFKVYEDNAKITRDACRIQAFNRFLNASEMLEAFIRDMAPAGIRQDQVLKVPVEAFINWLIFKAAEADGDKASIGKWAHRCGYCQKFIPKKLVAMGVNFCNAVHLDKYLIKQRPLLEGPK